MRIMPKIALSMWDILGKSYSKYENHPWMFVTVRPNILEAEWAAEEEKDEKKKKSEEKNLGRNY